MSASQLKGTQEALQWLVIVVDNTFNATNNVSADRQHGSVAGAFGLEAESGFDNRASA
jgi:hypothetical protein